MRASVIPSDQWNIAYTSKEDGMRIEVLGEPTGWYRVSDDVLLTDASGISRFPGASTPDGMARRSRLSIAFVDEVARSRAGLRDP